jgi:hypothetical protein
MTKLARKVNKEELKPRSFIERKLEGLNARYQYRDNKIKFVLDIEKLWEKYALDRTEQTQQRLLKALEFTIKQKAEAWGYRWKNKRLSIADFESVFYEEAMKLCEKYYQYNDFYFYETFLLALERRGLDVARKVQKGQNKFESEVFPLKDETVEFIPNDVDIESDVLNHVLVEQILNDQVLTAQERYLLYLIYNNVDASYSEIAKKAGFNHHEQVRRMLKRISNKLKKSYIFL